MVQADETLRADARENRARILEVARQAFAADPQASLNSIAKTAGIGAGTLYRHFPSREALILGVYRMEIDALVNLAPALLEKHPPLEAFRLWCERLADYGRLKHGVADVLHGVVTDRDRDETYFPMVDAIARLLRAGEASGEFAAGADAEDVLLLLGFLWRIKPDEESKARADRLIDRVIRGLGHG